MTKIILVVDDNPNKVFSVKKDLEDLDEDYKIISADDGEQCLKTLDYLIPGIILLDIMMPGLNGWDVAARIKENPKWKDIPLIFLTAKADSFSQTFGSYVSDDYITKPFNIKDLSIKINKTLRG